jgi:thioredoxin 1
MKGNFDSLIKDNRPVVVDFHALWCSPFKVQYPILKDVATELGDKIKVIKIDVDQNSNIASQYKIQSVPTIMIFKKGEIIYKQPGVHTREQLVNKLLQNL